MRKELFRATSIFLVAVSLFIFQSTTANAIRCTYGQMEIILTIDNVMAICMISHSAVPEEGCMYEYQLWGSPGPECVPGTMVVVENPCHLYHGCQSVVAINYCFDPDEPDEHYDVTALYEKALIYIPWECPDDCFFGDCTQGFYPECSRRYEECPGP